VHGAGKKFPVRGGRLALLKRGGKSVKGKDLRLRWKSSSGGKKLGYLIRWGEGTVLKGEEKSGQDFSMRRGSNRSLRVEERNRQKEEKEQVSPERRRRSELCRATTPRGRADLIYHQEGGSWGGKKNADLLAEMAEKRNRLNRDGQSSEGRKREEAGRNTLSFSEEITLLLL